MPPKSTPVYCAAVDLGATSGRVMVGTWAKNRLELREVHRFPNGVRQVGDNAYWDIPGLWEQVQQGLELAAQSLPEGEELASVGIDTWGVDYVLVDESGRGNPSGHHDYGQTVFISARLFQFSAFGEINPWAINSRHRPTAERENGWLVPLGAQTLRPARRLVFTPPD